MVKVTNTLFLIAKRVVKNKYFNYNFHNKYLMFILYLMTSTIESSV